MAEKNEDRGCNENNETHHIKVAISTTSGFFPTEGFDIVPANQKVSVELQKAQISLNLVDTEGWVAEVDKVQIDPDKSYAENSLSDEVEISWGPSEGGGGNA